MKILFLARRYPILIAATSAILFIAVIIVAGVYADRQVIDYHSTSPSPQSMSIVRFPGALDRYDTGHYQSIVANGYNSTTVAFFPLYPLLARGLTFFGISPLAALLVISWVFSILTAIVVYLWAAYELRKRKITLSPWGVLGLFALFPSSFFLAAGYGESLFIFLITGSLYAYRRGWYVASGIFAAFATASRVQGGVLALFFLADIIINKKYREWPRYTPVIFAPIGIIVYMTYLANAFGDPFAFIAAQHQWGRLDGNPVQNLISSFTPLYLWYIPVLGLMLWTVHKYLGKAWLLFCAASLLLPLASGRLDSINRYMLALPPLFLALGIWLNQRPQWQQIAYIVMSAFLLAWNVVLFFNGYWVA